MTTARRPRVRRTIVMATVTLAVCVISMATATFAAEQVDQENLPEWGGGWTHVNPTGEGQAAMWQTFTPSRANLTAVEIDILTINPGQGDDILAVEIAEDGAVLASAQCAVEDGFEGLLRFEFAQSVPVVPEQVYELKVRDAGRPRFGWKYATNTYERGSRYVIGQERPGTDWLFRTYGRVEPVGGKYGGGTGEPNDPYLIYTAAHLNALGAEPNDYDKHLKLMADIDLSGHSYDRAVIAPDVGGDGYTFPAPAFTGVFDGNGHAVSNLTITGESYLGLFGQVGPGGQVHGLGVVDVNITGSYYAIGGLVGDNDLGLITRSYSTGAVTGYNFVGGLVGYNNYGDIALSYSHCSARGTSSGNQGIGGLVGVTAGSITKSYSTGDVSGQRKVGGLVGRNYQSNITNCYSTGVVSGDSDIGGLVGASNDGITTASFWDMDASGQSTSAGGTGLTSAEMQTASTFLAAGWDFVDETENGPNDVWKIAEGLDYPRLWWEAYDGQVTLEVGQRLTVRLESNPSTGYLWEWVDRQASILEQIGEAEFTPGETGDPPLVGAGGWDVFTFEAVSSGQMTLELVYRRPWEEGVEPLKTFSLQVIVPQST